MTVIRKWPLTLPNWEATPVMIKTLARNSVQIKKWNLEKKRWKKNQRLKIVKWWIRGKEVILNLKLKMILSAIRSSMVTLILNNLQAPAVKFQNKRRVRAIPMKELKVITVTKKAKRMKKVKLR